MSAQRNDEFSSDPWRTPPQDREAVLSWFLLADLRTPTATLELRRRTGREGLGGGGYRLADGSVWIQHPNPSERNALIAMYRADGLRVTVTEDLIPPSREPGRRVVAGPCTVAAFVAFYVALQDTLHAVQRAHARYLETRRQPNPTPALGAQSAMLAGLLEDVPLTLALRRARVRRTEVSVLDEPLRAEQRPLSFAGDLGLAMLLRLIHAREAVLCPSCDELTFFPDVRNREICSKLECRRWYRAKWARQDYAAQAARRKAQGGKTRKR